MQAGASHGVAVGPSASVELAAAVGWGSADYNAFYFGTSSAGLDNAQITAGLPWHAAPWVTITPAVGFSTLLGDAKDVADAAGVDTSAPLFGISARASF